MKRDDIHALAAILHGPDAKIRDMQNDVLISCPFAPHTSAHKSNFDNNPSFSIRVEDDGSSVARCFTCEHKGLLLHLVERLDEYTGSGAEAVQFVRDNDTVSLSQRFKKIGARQRSAASRQVPPSEEGKEFALRCAKFIPEYAEQRGIVLATSRRWGIGYDAVRERMTMPAFASDGSFVGLIGRTVVDHPIRYHVYREYSERIKSYLFGEHVLDPTEGTLHLVEGPIDAVCTSQVVKNVVAVMGSNLSEAQRNRVKALAEKVVVIADGDGAGTKFAQQVVQSLRKILPVKIVTLPEGTDPGALPLGQLKSCIDDAALVL